MKLSSDRNKKLGQCFLEDQNILKLEAKLAQVSGKTILEIGPGDGRLTSCLLAEKPKKIIAVELDPKFAAILREKFSKENVEIVEADFLELEFPGCDIVIGNIPYYISSDIVFKLAKQKIEKAILMVQKEFAEKMVAKSGDGNYGRLSVTSQLAFDIKLERTVLRHLFRPMPIVDSAIIVLRPTGMSLNQKQENVIRWLFQHKNKTVRNALMDSKMFTKEEIEKLGAFLKQRPKALTKEECLEIAKILDKV
ncbi:putative ribosomal RNA small subunit methyltransferase A [Candidatus Bilamarchaeum dharawalense]|uniref:Putative ribosomal RNA small subunit methyltransferase A n=1 Tax=Candidatus Bilamarchaeum dharawalense TaxID=2885759 RepID=A0A5E4LVG8_9ARCH|nr:putative ribosomal RNA small subunit methyltransferase A [Candidatus Bilamarchaeum dharawalense]